MVKIHIKSVVRALEFMDEDRTVEVIGSEGTNPIRYLGAFEIYGSVWGDPEVDMCDVTVGDDTILVEVMQDDYDRLVEECC